MKSKWYRSKGMKFVLIILAHIFVITATTGGLWVTAYPIFRQEIWLNGSCCRRLWQWFAAER